MPAPEPSSQHADPQFTVYVAKAKWPNFATLSVLLSSKTCGTELMEHSEISGIFPTLS